MQLLFSPFLKVEHRLKALEYRYFYDFLTKLKNTNALVEDLKNDTFSALILIDIDGFQNYNELYGMEIGDIVIQQFSSYLKKFAQDKAYDLYRIYGDHFVLRCVEYATHVKFEKDLEVLFSEVEELSIVLPNTDETLLIDITVGLSLEKKMALKKAQMALKYAKKRKLSYVAYSRLIDTTVESQKLLLWKNEIKTALLNDNVIPVFQPIVDRAGEIVKYEALMRLRKEVNGKEDFMTPALFLDISHKSKQYEKLTRMMVEKIFTFMEKNGMDFSINLSFADIINRRTINHIKQKMTTYNIAHQLIFEIVESENIDDFEIVKEFITEFKELGVRIAIDDFGTGYSNFTHIFALAPDIIKIDGSLITEIDQDKKSYELVKSIVQLSKALGTKTVAEYVETKEIFDICYILGIDYFQGYYFYKPLPQRFVTQGAKKRIVTATTKESAQKSNVLAGLDAL